MAGDVYLVWTIFIRPYFPCCSPLLVLVTLGHSCVLPCPHSGPLAVYPKSRPLRVNEEQIDVLPFVALQGNLAHFSFCSAALDLLQG